MKVKKADRIALMHAIEYLLLAMIVALDRGTVFIKLHTNANRNTK